MHYPLEICGLGNILVSFGRNLCYKPNKQGETLMKKIRALFTALAVMTMLVGTLGLTTNRAYADVNDDKALEQVNTAIDKLWQTMEGSPVYSQRFYQSFAAQADETAKQMAAASQTMARSTETGEAAETVKELRNGVGAMHGELTKWRAAALAQNQAAFDAANEKFNTAIDRYNAAIDRYNAAAILVPGLTGTQWFYRLVLIGAVLLSLVLFAWARFRKAAPEVKRARLKVALHSLWPLAGAAVNYILYFHTPLTVYYGYLGFVLLGFIPFGWAIWSYRHPQRDKLNLPQTTVAIPLGKFLLLSGLTLGVYQVYWAWKAWETVGHAEGKRYRSAVRAIFVAFTALSLFPKMLALAKKEGYKKSYPGVGLAVLYLALSLLALVPTSNWLHDGLDVLFMLVMFGALLLLPLPVVAAANFYATQAGHKAKALPRNKRFIIVLVAISLLVSVASFFIYPQQ
jgi:hypothetical protein